MSVSPRPVTPRRPRAAPPAAPAAWRDIASAAALAAVTTAVSQIAANPVEQAAAHLLRGALPPPARAFAGVHLHLLKHLPTKTLSAALLQAATHHVRARHPAALQPKRNPEEESGQQRLCLRPGPRMALALASGAAALLATYPLHAAYNAAKKGVPVAATLAAAASARAGPAALYAGALPAVLATVPAAAVESAALQQLREAGVTRTSVQACLLSVAASKCLGAAVSEPLKAVSKALCVESVTTAVAAGGGSAPATAVATGASAAALLPASAAGAAAAAADAAVVRQVVGKMASKGLGEFWRGFPKRSMRVAASSVVGRMTTKRLRKGVFASWPVGSS